MSSGTLKSQRPVNLDLLTIKQPITAIVSILHRISGILIFLLMPLMLYGLQHSLASPENFACAHHCFGQSTMKFFTWIFFSALIYHVFAGIRHLLMDIGFGEHVAASRKSAWIVLILSLISILWLGIALW